MSEILIGSAAFTVIVLALALAVIAARAFVLPSRTVEITVNDNPPLPASTGGKLLGVLHDAGIPVPSACAGAGTCGLCRVTVTSGGGETLPTEAARMSKPEIRAGLRLACQVTIRNDLTVTVPDEILSVASYKCVVAEAKMLSPLIREITLQLPSDADFDFRPGAFVQVTAPAYQMALSQIELDEGLAEEWRRMKIDQMTASSDQPEIRAYSIANTPADQGRVVLLVRLAVPPPHQTGIPPGVVSSYLFGLKAGDELTVAGPYGTFSATDTDREMVLIGGGVGMAPLRAIIFDQLEQRHTRRKLTFWYGARSRKDLFYADEFDALAASHDNFDWTVALSDPAPDEDWDGPTGFIHAVAYANYLKDHPAPEDCEYYLCGPPLMIEAVLAMLDQCGVDEEAIFNDDFGA